jgi:hypothetical protein
LAAPPSIGAEAGRASGFGLLLRLWPVTAAGIDHRPSDHADPRWDGRGDRDPPIGDFFQKKPVRLAGAGNLAAVAGFRLF